LVFGAQTAVKQGIIQIDDNQHRRDITNKSPQTASWLVAMSTTRPEQIDTLAAADSFVGIPTICRDRITHAVANRSPDMFNFKQLPLLDGLLLVACILLGISCSSIRNRRYTR